MNIGENGTIIRKDYGLLLVTLLFRFYNELVGMINSCLHRFYIAIIILCAFLYFSNVERFRNNEEFIDYFPTIDIKYGTWDVEVLVYLGFCGLLTVIYFVLWFNGATLPKKSTGPTLPPS